MDAAEIAWHRTTIAERKCLNEPVNALRRRRGQTWSEAFKEAFGERDHVGDRFEDNLRKGKVAAGKAYKLFAWLERHDPALAGEVRQAIYDLRLASSPRRALTWDALLREGAFDGVRVVKLKPGLNALDFVRTEPVDPANLYLMDHFHFEVTAPFAGRVIAFHEFRGEWFVLPLSETAIVVDTARGTVALPLSNDGRPAALREDANAGQHAFFFLIAAGGPSLNLDTEASPHHPLRNSALDKFAAAASATPRGLRAAFRINVLFKRR
ncbi:hypothetical protein HB662_27985 [Roseomonas frigidaquae]|uniref:DUF4238 domain-containing protein n=1 Tax=Falsiroseomonas frigidaquae TaxID=487318 RepID=A0ABX1F8C8_9PROT|nr:hypothetical protein [Falsiroseomonas frigidaquae]NKE48639.1 hypothetical protein [Falsiroseomonas frigidaquae]